MVKRIAWVMKPLAASASFRSSGVMGKPAHRFFFRPEEVEPLDDPAEDR